MGEMRTLAAQGDIKSIWDPKNDEECEAAEEQFDTLIEKGYNAFKVGRTGKKGVKIDEFDRDAGKIILVPPLAGG